ncbi:hypothetical protein KR009_002439 [Drosophila setifemur]|nr:hypothetical protein KR009_002439 [Drosophila setifemur]
MFKYLAGIFAKPRNDYVDGPRTHLGKSWKVKGHPRKCPQVKISIKTTMYSNGEINSQRRRRKANAHPNPRVLRPLPRPSLHPPAMPQIDNDPICYIADVAASSTSIDVGKSVVQLRNKLPKERTRVPIPPPATPVESWTSLEAAFQPDEDLATPQGTWLTIPEEFWSDDSDD